MWVKLRHADGTVTLYGHVNTTLVSVGQRVMAGDQIATMGNRGNSTGPHLHFEVLLGGTQRVDPVPWLAKRGLSRRHLRRLTGDRPEQPQTSRSPAHPRRQADRCAPAALSPHTHHPASADGADPADTSTTPAPPTFRASHPRLRAHPAQSAARPGGRTGPVPAERRR